jgi:hypothetical protein
MLASARAVHRKYRPKQKHLQASVMHNNPKSIYGKQPKSVMAEYSRSQIAESTGIEQPVNNMPRTANSPRTAQNVPANNEKHFPPTAQTGNAHRQPEISAKAAN